MPFESMEALKDLCSSLRDGDEDAAKAAAARQDLLTKPRGSLGRLEDLAIWLARWQRRAMPRLEHVAILVFAGSHGVTRRGVSAFPAEVTPQMVANYQAGGAAINQLARAANATLSVIPLSIDTPTADFTAAPALSDADFLNALGEGYGAVDASCDLICLGEMGIGNTSAAAAVCLGLYGGTGAQWAGRGTGVDDKGLARKIETIETAVAFHNDRRCDPLSLSAALGGRELAAMMGAALASRQHNIPVIIDGFVATAALAPLYVLNRKGLDHALCGHVSAENAHKQLLERLAMRPLLNLDMRLGEASGAAVAIHILRAALACHTGMATFTEAGVSGRTKD